MQVTNTLQGFYSELTANGVHLKHQFRLSVPNVYGSFDAGAESLISMFARGATVPGVTQNKNEVKYLAHGFQVPSNFQMDNSLDLTIICDAAQKLRNGFVKWTNYHSAMYINGGASGGGAKRTPAPNIRITLDLLDETFTKTTDSYALIGIFPTKVGTIEQSQESADVATFTVSFAYQYWENNVVRSLPTEQGGILGSFQQSEFSVFVI